MENEAHEPVTAERKGHNEGPRLTALFGYGIVHKTSVTEIDLALLARGRFNTDRHI